MTWRRKPISNTLPLRKLRVVSRYKTERSDNSKNRQVVRRSYGRIIKIIMRNCIILGSGRSGTSAAAGALITANPEYYSGGNFVSPRISNPDGTFEPVTIRSINEDVLSQVVPRRPLTTATETYRYIPTQWQRWLARIPVETLIPSTPNIEKRIKEQTQKKPFCFKDPRFSYTLDVWYPHLEDCVFVCMFRHPAETAKSIIRFTQEFELMQDFEISYNQALEAWSLLNQHILEKHYPKGGEWLFLHLDQLFTDDGMNRLAKITDAKVNRSFANQDRVRTKSFQEVPPHTQAIYERLCELANYRIKLKGDEKI